MCVLKMIAYNGMVRELLRGSREECAEKARMFRRSYVKRGFGTARKIGPGEWELRDPDGVRLIGDNDGYLKILRAKE